MAYLVDTNVISELVRPRPDRHLLAWAERLDRVVLSAISIEELTFGVARAAGARRSALGRWLDAVLASAEVLAVTAEIARTAGQLRAARETRGRRVAQADMLIAATALNAGLTLATRNLRDFDGTGVRIVDPFAAPE